MTARDRDPKHLKNLEAKATTIEHPEILASGANDSQKKSFFLVRYFLD